MAKAPTSAAATTLPPLLEKRIVLTIDDKGENFFITSQVGCGLITLDYLAMVDAFPKPDDKIRSKSLQVGGGGNAGNTLTCTARLGLSARLISKVADDDHGTDILSELKVDGVDVSNVVISKGGTSSFTYVIVDSQTRTRTCITTRGFPAMCPDELPPSSLLSALEGARLAYFDGLLHKTALIVAHQADQMKIPILVDAEPEREKSKLNCLLNLASYIVCSEKFPEMWSTVPSIPCALLSILLQFPRLKFLIVTLGENGCMMLERRTDGEDTEIGEADIELVTESLQLKVDKNNALPTCVSSKSMRLSATGVGILSGRLLLGTAEIIPSSELVDTTGAGDAFIGAILYALCEDMPPEKMLPFACQVAAAGCRALGARTGLPRRTDPQLAPFLH